MTAGWGETEVPMEVSSQRLAHVLHRHLAEHGLLSFLSLLRAFRLHVIKRNRVHGVCPARLAAFFSEERGCAALLCIRSWLFPNVVQLEEMV